MPVNDRVARTVRAIQGLVNDARYDRFEARGRTFKRENWLHLQPTHDFMRGVDFVNDLGEVQCVPVSVLGKVEVRVLCQPKVGEFWWVSFSTFAPGIEQALLAALRTICWKAPDQNGELHSI